MESMENNALDLHPWTFVDYQNLSIMPFHGGNRGSNPLGDATSHLRC
jgi:hypothetical protein